MQLAMEILPLGRYATHAWVSWLCAAVLPLNTASTPPKTVEMGWPISFL
jgi:hypothetical protein